MSNQKIQMVEFVCDGCGRRVVVDEGELADGYHGQTVEAGSWGSGGSVIWFAHTAACIRKAVLNVIERAREEGRL